MKIFALLFALYTMMLSIAPCSDGLMGKDKTPPVIELSHNSHHQDNTDDCSPFCQCTCCQSFVVIAIFHPLPAIPAFSQKQFSAPAAQIPSRFAADFWQPPRF